MLSVIISTMNSERPLVRTLAALVPAAAAGIVREVVITDGGSSDATLEVADIAGCNVVDGGGSVADRFKVAVARARADWLMFLRPGTILDPAWAEEAARFVQQVELEATGRQRAATFRRPTAIGSRASSLAAAMDLIRNAVTGGIHPEQGLVIARRHYERLGGHAPGTPDPERDLLRKLGRRDIARLQSGATFAPDGPSPARP